MFKLIWVSAALVATAAVAQAPNDAPPSNKPGEDPNEVICINQPTTGSRVNNVRVCRTRAQWVESRAEIRKTVERVQSNKQTSGQ